MIYSMISLYDTFYIVYNLRVRQKDGINIDIYLKKNNKKEKKTKYKI